MANYRERERSIVINLVVDFILLLPDIVAAVMANSLTMMADVLKCVNEVQESITMIQAGIEQHIKGSFVAIVPSTKPVRKHYDEPS